MKKFLVLFLVLAITSMTGATQQLLTNPSFEIHSDDGYGRIMPDSWDLWTEDWNWDSIPDFEVKTLSVDGIAPGSGDASFQIDTSVSGGDAALIYMIGQLGTNVGLGWYHVGGFIKGNVGSASADIGIDIFSPDWGTFYWGGGAAITDSGDWTYFGFDFEVTDPTANYNVRVKSTPGSSFLIDDAHLVTEIPEPATVLLLAFGSLALLRKRRT
jgi:hypothetical protein